MSNDVIVCQATEDSNDSETDNEEPTPTELTNSELTQALMTLSVFSDNTMLAEIEADIIVGKPNTMQKEISNFCVPRCLLLREIVPATSDSFFYLLLL